MIAEVGYSIPEQCFQTFALRADLPRSSRIRRDRHIQVGQREEGVRGAARAKFDDGVRLRGYGGIVDRFEEPWYAFERVGRGCMTMRRVVAERRCIHVLAVEFQPIEAPLLNSFGDELRSVLTHLRRCGTEIENIPVRNFVFRSILIEQQLFRMLFDEIAFGIDGHGRPP
jgi:hypothetical protein